MEKENGKNFEEIEDKDMNYRIDLNDPKLIKRFEKANELFNNNYSEIIRKVQGDLKDLLILIRKYQFFIKEVNINYYNLNFDDNKPLKNIEKIYEIKNIKNFVLNIDLLPKFKINEINFEIPENVLNLTMTNIPDDVFQIKIPNIQKEISEKNYNMIIKLISKLYSNLKKPNHFANLKELLNYLENYFPEIVQRAQELVKEQSEHWSQEEQSLLEQGLIKYKCASSSKEKFKLISELIGTKTSYECIQRYKFIKENKDKIEKLEKKNENVKEANERKGSSSQEKVKSENKTENCQHNAEKSEKKIKVYKFHEDKGDRKEITVDPQPELIEIKKKEEDTMDLIDSLLNEFSNYVNVDFSKKKSEDPTQLTINEEDDDDESFEKDEKYDSNNEESEEDDQNVEIVKKKRIRQTKKTYDIATVKSVIELLRSGTVQRIVFSNLTLRNISLAIIAHLRMLFRCGKCKKTLFYTNFIEINSKQNILYSSGICPTCKNQGTVLFKPMLLHMSNLTNGGYIVSHGAIPQSIVSLDLKMFCINCLDNSKSQRRNPLITFNEKCDNCHCEMTAKYSIFTLNESNFPDYSFLEQFTLDNYKGITVDSSKFIDDNSANQIKKGGTNKPLPDKGICKHYSNSFRWFRFPCCGRDFPCDVCHDDATGHESAWAKVQICGYCSAEQDAANSQCITCRHNLTKLSSGTYWEGGKGCRDKAKMSNKDCHKFRNSELKTVSRKKRENK